jgi:hypothetical protein
VTFIVADPSRGSQAALQPAGDEVVGLEVRLQKRRAATASENKGAFMTPGLVVVHADANPSTLYVGGGLL